MRYAFVLDASACTGCKACQVACKDKNELPLGVLWRRVYEVSGGSWKQEGEAWTTTVFTYNLSLSCNHCEHPKCAGVCPVDAFDVRQDGIVVLDASKCVGCGYCAWACPYGAPQYDASRGRMNKCDFCYDNLEAGLPPACVAACPLRVLDYALVDDGQAPPAGRVPLWEIPADTHPFPMANNSRTEPYLALKPHAAMSSPEEKLVANREEVRPRVSARGEAPLVAFTLLVQAAVGGLWATLLLSQGARQWLPMLLVGLCLGAGMLMSFAHLGTKRNAWRVLSHLKKSWLSREILFTLLFGAGWLATMGSLLLGLNPVLPGAVTGLLGLRLIYCMARVYALRSVPAWNSWRTLARFDISAGLLGTLAVLPMVAAFMPPAAWNGAGVFVIALAIAEGILSGPQVLSGAGRQLQRALLAVAVLSAAAVFFIPGWYSPAFGIGLLLVVLAEQVVGRWFFYEARVQQTVA